MMVWYEVFMFCAIFGLFGYGVGVCEGGKDDDKRSNKRKHRRHQVQKFH